MHSKGANPVLLFPVGSVLGTIGSAELDRRTQTCRTAVDVVPRAASAVHFILESLTVQTDLETGCVLKMTENLSLLPSTS